LLLFIAFPKTDGIKRHGAETRMQVTKLRGFGAEWEIHFVIPLGWYHSC
jgi:hypothetical protein